MIRALEAELSELAGRGLARRLPRVEGAQRPMLRVDGREALNFSSNDYLSLANHPRLKEAARAALERLGVGAGASRLICGDLEPHRALEALLASTLGGEAALLFPSGYQANLGVLTTLAGPEDLIVSDARNHASIIDGCRLSRAQVTVVPHRDVEAVARALADGPARRARRRLLVTESIFSMDGDRAPLAELVSIARAHDAWTVVDEAHAFGVVGPAGAGLAAALGVQPEVRVGTLGKAFGAAGAFVLGAAPLRALLLAKARSFIFTTALAPAIAAAAASAVALSASAEGDERRARLLAAAARVRAGLAALGRPVADDATPIVPLLLGDEQTALATSARLLERGLFAQAIRPPTVPPGTSRLRLTVQADHGAADVDRALCALGQVLGR